jgi:hypothetical protein
MVIGTHTAWSVTVRLEYRLSVFENRELRKIFRPKRKAVAVGWRRLHSEEFHNQYSSRTNIRVIKSRKVRWAGHVARMGKMRNASEDEGKRPRGIPRRNWDDNIRMDLKEIVLEFVDWIHLAQDSNRWRVLVNMVMKLWFL